MLQNEKNLNVLLIVNTKDDIHDIHVVKVLFF